MKRATFNLDLTFSIVQEAANSIKKDDKQEIADHKWLKKEVSVLEG